MNEINFLPQRIVHQSADRRRRARTGGLISLLLTCLVGWGVHEFSINHDMSQQVKRFKDQVATARNQMSEVVKLGDEYKRLQTQVDLQRELSQPISHTQTFVQISETLPESVALLEIHIASRRPAPKALEDDSKRKRKSKKSKVVELSHNDLQITLDGVAPDDLTIANMIGDLSDHPLFDQIYLEYTRSIEARGVQARAFRLKLRLRLDRRFKLEVADASR